MNSLDEVLSNAKRARLIPSLAESRKEEKLVSVLLAVLGAVRPFAAQLLGFCGVRVGKTSDVESYTEVVFPTSDPNRTERPDGVLNVTGRNKVRWTALFEAKVDNAEIDEEQVLRYGEVARSHGINTIITLSNQLVPLPTHIPYSVPKRLTRKLEFYHISWTSIRTQAMLTLKDSEDLSEEQRFIMEEMVRYFEHSNSGVKRFDQMNREWRQLVLGIRHGEQFQRTSPEIENTVASWHQEERDVCLILTRRIGERVDIRLPRKYRTDIALRLRDACDSLVSDNELISGFLIPNAASDLEVVVNLQRRTISCSMKLQAPGDRKRAASRINWILRQLRNVEGDDVFVRAFWSGRSQSTQAVLQKVQEDPGSLEIDRTGAVPVSFEVLVISDLAGRFSGRSTFIEDLEKAIPGFYDRVGQNLRKWVPPPPSIDKRDPKQTPDESEGDGTSMITETISSDAESR